MNEKPTLFFHSTIRRNHQKSQSTEIETGLSNLGDNTLLFLSHIRKIEYTLPNGEVGSLQRINHNNGRIEIRQSPGW